MSDNSTKEIKYLKGSAREKVFDNGGRKINVDILKSDLDKLPVNEAGYVKITLSSIKGGQDQFGNNYSITPNDFVPDPSKRKGADLTPPPGYSQKVQKPANNSFGVKSKPPF